MSIEIIKRGQLPEDKEYFGTCYRCRTEVKFLRKDAIYESYRGESTLSVPCPVCNNSIVVDA